MKRSIQALIILIVLGLLFLGIQQFFTLRKAHSTFENYYAFRGCVQLVKKTPDYGICKLESGKTIKIVMFNGKWYLNNDLPICRFNFCL